MHAKPGRASARASLFAGHKKTQRHPTRIAAAPLSYLASFHPLYNITILRPPSRLTTSYISRYPFLFYHLILGMSVNNKSHPPPRALPVYFLFSFFFLPPTTNHCHGHQRVSFALQSYCREETAAANSNRSNQSACVRFCTSRPASVYVLPFPSLYQSNPLAQGNQIGASFWQTISGEHGLDGSGV